MTIDSDHTQSFICSHVFDDSRPVLLVVREAGDWQFLCGDNHDFERDGVKVVGRGHLLARDPSLIELLDLGLNEEAEREAVGSPWQRRPFSPEVVDG